jgi:hypothetical protein
MKLDDPFPFRGVIVWLTPEQGGRKAIPVADDKHDYAATAFVPPLSAMTGLASFVLRGFAPGALRSPAEGRWLVVKNEGDQLVESGTVVVVTEGNRPVGYFLVEHVDPDD